MLGSESFLFTLVLLAPAFGALVALLLPRRGTLHLAHLLTLAGAVAAVVLAVTVLSTGAIVEHSPFAVVPFARIALRLDALAAFFLGVIAFVTVATSIFALGYVRTRGTSDVRWLGAGYPLFILSMLLVVLADNAFTFLLVWELMAVVSFVLVVSDHHDADIRRAGFIYVVMSHLGTAFVVAAFLTLFVLTGSFEFAAFRAAAAGLPPQVRDLVFLLALVGLGTKAGIMPLHVWLPRAHPAAPSHVSALMSGVMIKTAIYAFLRFTLEFLSGPGAAPTGWWGLLLVGLGAVSAVLGLLNALMERDLKRLLAYSSVENVGIILIGIGGCIYLLANSQAALAAIALTAGLLHVLNHATFKSLLFLGAGAVQHAAHTRNVERLGGLLRRMPWTGLFFLVGSAAIVGLPPLNGFVGEWLTFQTLLAIGLASTDGWVLGGMAAATGMLALSVGLAAACFVNAFGITFLAIPRSHGAEGAREHGMPMLLGMGLLAIACLALGLVPGQAIRLLEPVAAITGASVMAQIGEGGWLIAVPVGQGLARPAIAPAAIGLLLVVLASIPLAIGWLLGGRTRTRVGETWACGVTLRPEMEYTATAFAKPFRLIFGSLLRPDRRVERQSVARYFVTATRYQGEVHPLWEGWLYRSLERLVVVTSSQVRQLQNGSIRLYLGYMFATLVVLLLVAR